ncbi:MAG: sialidase family protein [Pseudomonadota bacterium]|nr:sialidase family protein [Pseudomonadota bacterium]
MNLISKIIFTIVLCASSFGRANDTVQLRQVGFIESMAVDKNECILITSRIFDPAGAYAHAWLYRSCDLGTTWEQIAYVDIGAKKLHGTTHIRIDGIGRLYWFVMGRFGRTVVMVSEDGGKIWSDFDLSPGYINEVVIDSLGNIFVTAATLNNGSILTVSNDHGRTWTVIKSDDKGGSFQFGGLFSTKKGEVYLSERTNDFLYLLKTTDQGKTWEKKVVEEGSSFHSPMVFVDNNGRVYLTGSMFSGKGTYWLVKVSEDGGNTWKDSDKFTYKGNYRYNFPSLITSKSGNEPICIGNAGNSAGGPDNREVITRIKRGDSWELLDSYTPDLQGQDENRPIESLVIGNKLLILSVAGGEEDMLFYLRRIDLIQDSTDNL